jgi:hypothetical protein
LDRPIRDLVGSNNKSVADGRSYGLRLEGSGDVKSPKGGNMQIVEHLPEPSIEGMDVDLGNSELNDAFAKIKLAREYLHRH